MQNYAHKFDLKQDKEARCADLSRRALVYQIQQLAVRKEAVASASSDREVLMAQIKLAQTGMDGKILRGEIPAESQFMIGRARARRMTVKWDIHALMKTTL